MQEILERAHVGGLLASEPADECSGFPPVTSSLASTSVSGAMRKAACPISSARRRLGRRRRAAQDRSWTTPARSSALPLMSG